MSIDPTPNDPYGLGTDIALLGDIKPVWGLVTSFTNLGYALARRLHAVLGALFYDLGYGFDITDLVNQGLTPASVTRISQAIAAQCLLDERVQSCRVSMVLVPQDGTLAITITGTIAQGVPFTFILAATSVTVALLSVNGQPITTAPAAATATTGTGGTTVIIEGGGGGQPGPPGPPGPGGSAQATFNLNPNGYADNSGAEVVQDQIDVNLGALGGSITIELVGSVLSENGTATFRLYLGGSDNAADGTLVATITATTNSFTKKNNSSTLANPGGLLPLKLTIQSSAAGKDAQMDRGGTITIR